MNHITTDGDGNTSQLPQKPVAIWLYSCCALVFLMLVLGGVTRLTGSGLSIVDWQPISGMLPPLSEPQWVAVFERYQQSPQFKDVNSHMQLQDFKGIFWLEFLHRLLGRLIGLAFLLPLLFFITTGRIRRKEWPKYVSMFLLGGLQGLLGWYMVKSGLVNNPHVSQYRLVAHLLAAVLIYAYMFWVALSISFASSPRPRHDLYGKTLWLTMLVLLTIVSGGFVAGLKAGYVYNTFPLMNGHWIPPGMMVFSPGWTNFFDNLVTVQFDHRVLALLCLISVFAYWLLAQRSGPPAHVRRAIHALAVVVVIQLTLGISTLLLQVPTLLAATHQATAIVLFTIVLFLTHALRGLRNVV